jgi:hypothetical protein
LQIGNFSHIAKQLKTLRVTDQFNKRGQAQAWPFLLQSKAKKQETKIKKRKTLVFHGH